MKKLILVLLATTAIASCAGTGDDYKKPEVAVPTAYRAQVNANLPGTLAPANISPNWWQAFGSNELNSLVTQALADNNDLRASVARIAASRADLKAATATLFPSVDASADSNLRRTNPSTGKTTYARSLSAGLNVSYDLDFFGGNAAERLAAQENTNQSVFDNNALALITMSDTAKAFFTILGLRDNIATSQANYDNALEVLRIAEARLRVGAITGADVSRQKTSVGSALARLRSLEEQEKNAINALGILLGKTPEETSVMTRSVIDVSVPAINAGLPSDLLQRRPDIASAEAALKAANADIAVARAALYPSVNLGTGIDIIKSPISDPASTAIGLLASLGAPIFHGGALEAGVERATARQTELLENYRKTILVAFQEVENALEASASAADRVTILEATVVEARNAYDLTRRNFDAGAIDMETLITAQEALLSAQSSLSQARADRLLAAASLYAALGGGWKPQN